MKNIHVLPTDKPSRLSKDENDRIWLSINFEYGINDNNKQNIFITSDEEIGTDEYYLGQDNNIYCLVTSVNFKGKKIILTTDGDLIKDGVQAIDDAFLEWFVKNPSCEGIETYSLKEGNEELGYYHYKYEIIIPKEESQKMEFNAEVAEYLGFVKGVKWKIERLCDSEVIQRIRASKSDAEVRRIIRTV